jgi:hypothetical protein
MDLSKLWDIVSYIVENYHIILIGFHYIALFMVGLCMFLPGKQPEAFFKKLADWLERYSKK